MGVGSTGREPSCSSGERFVGGGHSDLAAAEPAEQGGW